MLKDVSVQITFKQGLELTAFFAATKAVVGGIFVGLDVFLQAGF
jgi:hypothetical protein